MVANHIVHLHRPSVEHFSPSLYIPGVWAGRGHPRSSGTTSVLPAPSTIGNGSCAVIHVVGTAMVVHVSLSTCCIKKP